MLKEPRGRCRAEGQALHQVCRCREGADSVLEQWDDWPQCMTHHLLVPANDHCFSVLRWQNEIQPQMPGLECDNGFGDWHDTFTNATKLFEGPFAVAAWAARDAQRARLLAVALFLVHGRRFHAPNSQLLCRLCDGDF